VKTGDGREFIHAYGESGNEVISEELRNGKTAEDYVGKELAQKFEAMEWRKNAYGEAQEKAISGADLKVGGEGMKGFYDKIVPDFLNKFGKKYGAKVGETEVITHTRSPSKLGEIPADLRQALLDNGSLENESLGFGTVRQAAREIVDNPNWKKTNGPITPELARIGDEWRKTQLKHSGPKVHSFPITEALKDAALHEGFSLFQQGEDTPRGRINFQDQGGELRSLIELFRRADKTTLPHELAHYFFEVMGRLSELETASQELKDDYATLLKALGVSSRAEVKTEHHEQIARWFEGYLANGKAPTPKLQRAFDRFMDWVTAAYRNLRQYMGAELKPEVAEVFDRWFATREEIQNARDAMGLTPIEVPEGVSPEVKTRLESLTQQAKTQAESALLKEVMGELSEKHQAFLKAERERLTKQATAEVNEIQLYRAAAELGKATRKNPWEQAHLFLADRTNDTITAKFEELAEVHGYDSGEAFARALVEADTQGGIEAELRARVNAGLEKHKMDPETLRAEALKAVHSEKMTELLALEAQVFRDLVSRAEIRTEATKRNRLEAKAEAEAATQRAKAILAKKPLKQATNPGPYITAERNAALAFQRAMAKKDYEAAAKAKREQMVNHALAKEALRNQELADKAVEYLTRDLANLEKMPFGFVRQVENLLTAVELGEFPPRDRQTLIAIAEKMVSEAEDISAIADATGLRLDENAGWREETLPEFLARINDDYLALDLPASVLNLPDAKFRDLPFQTAMELADAVKLIVQAGRKYDKFLGLFEKVGIREAAVQIANEVRASVGQPYAGNGAIGSQFDSEFKERLNGVLNLPNGVVPSLVNILTLTRFLQGGKETGPLYDFIYRRMKRAEEKKFSRYESMTQEVNALLEKHYTPEEMRQYKKERFLVPEFGRYMTKENILSLALNWGNLGNRDRIMRGFNLDEAQVMEVIDRHLEKRDLEFAQSVWDYLGSYWPDIVALEMRVRGLEPKAVEKAEVVSKHGTFPGGYFPIAYDFEKSSEAFKNAEQKNALYKQYSAAAAHTDTGHTEARVATVSRPVRLSMDVLFNHLENVVHDLEFREAVIDISRLLKQKELKTALEGAIGIKGYLTFSEWLKGIASDQGEHLSVADKIFRWFRFNTTFAQLAYRAFVLPMDLTGNVMNGVWEIGPARMLKAMTGFVTDREAQVSLAHEKSARMKRRALLRDRDLMDIAKKWSGKESAFQLYAFYLNHMADEAISIPLWNEAYKNAIDKGHPENTAIDIADETITRTVGSGSSIDQVGVQRGSEFQKMTSMYYSYMSMMFNRVWLDGKLAGLAYDKGNTAQAIGIIAKATFFAWGLQALNEVFWRELVRNDPDDGDDEEKAKRIASRIISQPFGYVWLLRDVSGFVLDEAMGKRGSSYRLSPVEQAVENILKPAGQAANIAFSDGKEFDERFLENVARSGAYVFGYPQSINALAFNFLDWMEGNGELTWKDFLQRRTRK
jgi:hypothetical protein